MQGDGFWRKLETDGEEEYTDEDDESSESGECWDYSDEEGETVVERQIKFQRQVRKLLHRGQHMYVSLSDMAYFYQTDNVSCITCLKH